MIQKLHFRAAFKWFIAEVSLNGDKDELNP